MSLRITTGKTLPIGIDLGSSCVKMAQLKTGPQATELLAAGSEKIPRACRTKLKTKMDLTAKCIRNLLKSHPFKGRHCVLSLPADSTFVHHVKIPKVAPGDVASAVQQELHGKLPYPVSEAVVRHIVAGEAFTEGNGKQEVISVSAPRRTIEAYLNMARRAKLDVIGINIEPCAIVDCFARIFRQTEDSTGTILFVDLGSCSTQVVLSNGGRIVFARNLTIGGEKLDEAVAEGMEITVEQAHEARLNLLKNETGSDDAEKIYEMLDAPLNALTDELTQCLRYHESIFRNQSVERTIFLGGQAFDKRLCQSIARRLNLPAQIGDPLLRIERGEGVGDGIELDTHVPQPNWAVAVGLSLGGAQAA